MQVLSCQIDMGTDQLLWFNGDVFEEIFARADACRILELHDKLTG